VYFPRLKRGDELHPLVLAIRRPFRAECNAIPDPMSRQSYSNNALRNAGSPCNCHSSAPSCFPDGSIQAGEYGAHGRCEYVQKRTFSKARRYEMQIRRGNLATPLVVEVDGIAKAGVQVEEAC
jgi:hypothetical protein